MYNVIVHTAVAFLTTPILPKYILYPNSSQSRTGLEIEKIIIHEEYCVGKAFAHDIALLKLKVDVSMFPPACLPPRDADYTGKPGSVYGWGREIETPAPPPCDNPRPPISPVLRETTQKTCSRKTRLPSRPSNLSQVSSSAARSHSIGFHWSPSPPSPGRSAS